MPATEEVLPIFPLSNVVVLLAMACIMMPIATRRMKMQMIN